MAENENMNQESRIAYHLRELDIAQDSASPHHILPEIRAEDKEILDIGCGIGQTLIACGASSNRVPVGVDLDQECLRYGKRHFNQIEYIQSSAEALPFADGTFNLIISRVTLPLTKLTLSLPEMARVLVEGGRIWITLHPFRMTLSHLKGAVRNLALKEAVFLSYVVTNGVIFHYFGRQFRLPIDGRCESFQTKSGMQRCLQRFGFTDIQFQQDKHFIFVCTARKKFLP